MYFSKHKSAVEIDEKGHADRNQGEENERQTKIKKYSYCKFFHRINPDPKGFEISLEISKIQNYITQSNQQKNKKQICKRIIKSHMQYFSKPLKHQIFC